MLQTAAENSNLEFRGILIIIRIKTLITMWSLVGNDRFSRKTLCCSRSQRRQTAFLKLEPTEIGLTNWA